MFDELPEPYRMIQAIGPVGGWEIAKGCGKDASVTPSWQLFLRPKGGEWVKGQAHGAKAVEKALEDFRSVFMNGTDIDFTEWVAPPPPTNWGRFG